MIWILAVLLCLALAQGQTEDDQCSKSTENQYDYIIVGAGTAGCVLANRLSEHPFHKVLLIEAGGSDRERNETSLIDTPALVSDLWNSSVSWRDMSEPQTSAGFGLNDRKVCLPRGKVIGGTMAINSMIYQRGHPKVYDMWSESGAHGWSYNDVEPYFNKIEEHLPKDANKAGTRTKCAKMRISENKISLFRDLYGNASRSLGYEKITCNEGKDEGFCATQFTIKSGERWNTAKAYLAPVMGRTNLDILTDAVVTKILLYQGTAVGVEYTTEEKKDNRVFARIEVIIAAGIYNTPKLLLLSGIGPREHLQQIEIPVMSNVPVGLNLKELPVIPLRIFWDIPGLVPELLVRPDTTLAYITNRTGLLSELSAVEGMLIANITNTTPEWPDVNLHFISTLYDYVPEVLNGWNIKPELISSWFSRGAGRHGIQIMVQLIHPYSRGRVELRSDNPDDSPRIDPAFLTDNRDVRELIKAVRLVNRLVNTEIFRKAGATMDEAFPECDLFEFNSTDYWECYIRYFTLGNMHGTGTVRMGDVSDNSAVLDPELRVKGIHGLRVVGSAAMPEPPGEQTAATIMMAERASDLIRRAAGVSIGGESSNPRHRPSDRGPSQRRPNPPPNLHERPMDHPGDLHKQDLFNGHQTPLSGLNGLNSPLTALHSGPLGPFGPFAWPTSGEPPMTHNSIHHPFDPIPIDPMHIDPMLP